MRISEPVYLQEAADYLKCTPAQLQSGEIGPDLTRVRFGGTFHFLLHELAALRKVRQGKAKLNAATARSRSLREKLQDAGQEGKPQMTRG